MSTLELDRGRPIRKRGREVPVSSWCRLLTIRLGFVTCRAVSSFQLRPDQCVTELRSGAAFGGKGIPELGLLSWCCNLIGASPPLKAFSLR